MRLDCEWLAKVRSVTAAEQSNESKYTTPSKCHTSRKRPPMGWLISHSARARWACAATSSSQLAGKYHLPKNYSFRPLPPCVSQTTARGKPRPPIVGIEPPDQKEQRNHPAPKQLYSPKKLQISCISASPRSKRRSTSLQPRPSASQSEAPVARSPAARSARRRPLHC